MYNQYWSTVWDEKDIDCYRKYLDGFYQLDNNMIRIFKEYHITKVCDVACGFGAYSLVLHSNGFEVYGFDVSEQSVAITSRLLSEYGLQGERFIRADITNTPYPNAMFDAVTARAVLDHLLFEDLQKAVTELTRIVKKSGLIYASFDPLEKEDVELAHQVLEDGSYLYEDETRKGLLFHYYSDDEIKHIFKDFRILLFETDRRGNRHIVVATKEI